MTDVTPKFAPPSTRLLWRFWRLVTLFLRHASTPTAC